VFEFIRKFKVTPKALDNLSPGLERSDNPGLKLANAFGVTFGFDVALAASCENR